MHVALYANTGLTAKNYMAWDSNDARDEWFRTKILSQFEDVNLVRSEASRYGENVDCVHLRAEYSKVSEAEYISFPDEGNTQIMYATIVAREYVNAKSTRLYFKIDYVASYWDTLTLGACMIERTHVGDDWNGELTASNYLLPEPLPVLIHPRPDLLLDEPFQEVNDELDLADSQFNALCSANDDGTFDEPKILYQCGGALTGYVHTGTESEIEEKLSKYSTHANALMNSANSVLGSVKAIYITPDSVSGLSAGPMTTDIERAFNTIISREDMPKITHAKVLDYFRVQVTGNTGTIVLSPAECNSLLKANVIKTGGMGGNFTAVLLNKNDVPTGASVATNQWPLVGVTATIPAVEQQGVIPDAFKAGKDFITSRWTEKEARKAYYNSVL